MAAFSGSKADSNASFTKKAGKRCVTKRRHHKGRVSNYRNIPRDIAKAAQPSNPNSSQIWLPFLHSRNGFSIGRWSQGRWEPSIVQIARLFTRVTPGCGVFVFLWQFSWWRWQPIWTTPRCGIASLEYLDRDKSCLQSLFKDKQPQCSIWALQSLQACSKWRLQLHLLLPAGEAHHSKTSDLEIWTAVLNLIIMLSRVIPTSASLPPMPNNSTSIINTSALQQGVKQTKKLIDARVFEKIQGCIYQDVQGFYKKYFERKSWTDHAQGIYKSIKNQHVGSIWTELLQSIQDNMYNWLFQLQDDHLLNEQCRYYKINLSSELTGSEIWWQIDLLVKQKSRNPSNIEHNWKDIKMIGKLKMSDKCMKMLLIQFIWYMQDMFACQLTCCYLHVFIICRLIITAWIFNCSKCYSLNSFNIHLKSEQFIQLITGYTMMDEEKLDLNTFMKLNDNCCFIHIKHKKIKMKPQLKLDLFICQQAIICHRTFCFFTKISDSNDWSYMIKFSWMSDRQKFKANFLKLANQRGVEGIVRLIKHCFIINIKDMHSDIMFTKLYTFSSTSSTTSLFSQSFQFQPPSALSWLFSVHDLMITESKNECSKKCKSVDISPRPKQFRFNSHQSALLQNKVTYNVEKAQGASLLTFSDDPYNNCILCCLVIYPAGQSIYKYKSPLKLLKALCDAIKVHRSLYFKGNIFHWDIFKNNIIITDDERTSFAEMLIDINLAKEHDSRQSSAHCCTGTIEFMAIDMLFNTDHTYQHDLESFFYVLIWQCACCGWEFVCNPGGQPKLSLLMEWYTGNYEKIANAKQGNVGVNGFECILAKELPSEFNCVKSLCRKFRGILFPWDGNDIFTGTPKDPEVFYGPIIRAFDETIADIKEGE